MAGPRLFVFGHALSATGGHGDHSGFSPYLEFKSMNGIADGVDEIRKKVRWNIKYGADCIKMLATAGVLSEEESVGAPQYSVEEMKAVVDEAAMWGRKVAAHAHGTEGIKRAVRAGVASIEHGSLLDDEAIALMKEHGTFLVPTIYVGYAVEQHGKEWHLPDRLIEKAHHLNVQKMTGLRKAVQSGVKIAYGTDAGVFPHGENAADFRYLIELRMTPSAGHPKCHHVCRRTDRAVPAYRNPRSGAIRGSGRGRKRSAPGHYGAGTHSFRDERRGSLQGQVARSVIRSDHPLPQIMKLIACLFGRRLGRFARLCCRSRARDYADQGGPLGWTWFPGG